MQQQNTRSPVADARLARGLTRLEFARLAGRSLSAVAALENGYMLTLPESWRDGLEAAGFSFDDLARSYHAWIGVRAADTRSIAGAAVVNA